MYKGLIKPVLDRVIAALLLLFLGWLYLLLIIIVRIKLGSPVIFVQERAGKIDPCIGEEKTFKIYKFRTMSDERDSEGKLLPDDKRLNRFGRLLRSTSLDELPEIINILKGDMSFVGPRPLLVEYLPRYTQEQRRRHEVLPGLTGYAQVNGRNSSTWEQRFKDDVWYVDNISFYVDLKIFIKTISVVLMRKGISSDTSITMEKFKGTLEKRH